MSGTLEYKASLASPSDKLLIIEAADQVGGRMKPDPKMIKLLFIMFDRYVETYNIKNLKCNDCRVAIRNFWQKIVKEWKTN